MVRILATFSRLELNLKKLHTGAKTHKVIPLLEHILQRRYAIFTQAPLLPKVCKYELSYQQNSANAMHEFPYLNPSEGFTSSSRPCCKLQASGIQHSNMLLWLECKIVCSVYEMVDKGLKVG